MTKARTVIIGLDGVPFGMLKTFAETGIMPNTSRIIQDGLFMPMRSSIPEISSVAWSSIVTGAGPGEHGIYGFIDMQPDSYRIRFPNFRDLKVAPFWDRCDGQSVIINVPSTYPVREMNGVHISGFVSIDFEKSVHPKSLVPKLHDMNYSLDVDAQKAHTSMDLFLEDVDESLGARIEAYRYLWSSVDWQAFMLVFTGTDRLMHFLWNAYADEGHKHHGFFLEHFKRIDEVVGEIAGKMADDDTLIMLSDHGFEGLEKDIYVNCLLADEGFLSFRPGAEPKPACMDSATKAFALDPARIFINEKGKYPAGSVTSSDKEACLKDIEGLFASLEVEGKKVIKHIFRKQDAYSGRYLDEAPDLILIGAEGFNLKGAMSAKELVGKGPFTGKHTYPDAFLLTNKKSCGPEVAEPSVIDAGKLIRALVTRG